MSCRRVAVFARPWLASIPLCWALACGDDGGSGDGDSGSADSATGASTSTSNAGDDETTGDPLPDMGLQPPTVCASMCTARVACGEPEAACLGGCDADYANFQSEPAPCGSDFEALLGCVAALDCTDLATFDDPPTDGTPYPCEAEDEAFTLSCLLDGMPPPATCEAYCAVLTMCTEITPTECDAVCAQQLSFAEGLSRECGTSTTAMLDCVGTITECTDYEAYDEQTAGDPCAAEVATVEVDCAM